MHFLHTIIDIETEPDVSLHDITPQIRARLTASGMQNGFVVVTSRHTTTALTLNENEERLLADVKDFFLRLVPLDAQYRHNDIHLRDCPPDEPKNAHSHLIAMLLGGSEAIPVVAGQLALGTWQSIMLVELDGPRQRTVSLQLCGE